MSAITDPIADLLTRIRNASRAGHEQVDTPGSRLKLEIVKILAQEKFVRGYQFIQDDKQGIIRVFLKYGTKREHLAAVAVKNHANGAKNPKAHLQKPITEEMCLKAPIIAEPLGLFDCCGVSDGAACAIVTTPEIARSLGKKDIVTVKALQLALSNGLESQHNAWDGSYFHTARIASKRAYDEAGIDNPRAQVSMMEVHDCFSITELVTIEDLHISREGEGWRDVMNGFYDADGEVPCQIDGGLKCFGHPIGASGLRMLYEMYLQLLGRAGPRQLASPKIGLTHNLGGAPAMNVCSVAIIGAMGA